MEKKTLLNLLFALSAIGLIMSTSCQPAKPDLGKIKTEIQTMEDAYAAGLNAKDANAIISYYASDAVSMENNGPIITGKEAILKNIQKNLASDTLNHVVSFEAIDLFAAGELLVETGKAVYNDSNGNFVRSGKYISVFEKRDGKYVCIRDIYNDDSK